MTIEGDTAYLNQLFFEAMLYRGEDLRIGQRFEAPTPEVRIAASPVLANSWPGPIWRVDSLEGVEERANGAIIECRAFVPRERLEPWKTFGPRGQEVVAVLERIASMDGEDLGRARDLLGDLVPLPPRPWDRREVRGSASSINSTVGWALVEVARRLEPDALEVPDPNSVVWLRPTWQDVETTATVLCIGLIIAKDDGVLQPWRRRFDRLLPALLTK